jgi:DNA-binding response OmpR family regulator
MVEDVPTVLVVDDEEDVVEIYALGLADEYEVLRAYDGEEALEKVGDDVDVALLDRRMPGLSGDEVLEEIRRRGVDVRVAMVTAVDPDFDITQMEFDAYLTKPVDVRTLRGAVEELLTLREYDDQVRERFSVAERKATLEAEKSERELASSDEYDALREREAELDSEAERLDDMDDELFRKAISRFSDERPDD